MAPPLTVPEILDLMNKEKSTIKKREILGKYKYNTVFLDVLKGAFDESIVFHDVGNPEWTPSSAAYGLNYSNLYQAFKSMYFFQKGHPKGRDIDEYHRNKKLIQILESMHPADSEVFLSVLRKKINVLGLTATKIKETYPNLLES